MIAEELIAEGNAVADEDVGRNKEMSKWAGEWLVERMRNLNPDAAPQGLNVLTVCNTGSLATSVRHNSFSDFDQEINFQLAFRRDMALRLA